MAPFIGTILEWPLSYTPINWAFCNGQLLFINSHQSLYSLLGTTYGGDGRRTFGLPNLVGRVPVGAGRNPIQNLGDTAGSESVTLGVNNIPPHSHALNCNNEATSGDSNNPDNAYPGVGLATGSGPTASPINTNWASSLPAGGAAMMNIATIVESGGGLPHNNFQPSLGLNYIIALTGPYPSRN